MPNEALFTQGGNYDAVELRKLIAGIWSSAEPGGVISGMVVTDGGSSTVHVSPGFIFVYDEDDGAYLGYKTAMTPLSITSNSGGVSARVDTIQATISDPGVDETAGTVVLSVKVGTSSVDDLSIPLATVSVSTTDVLTITTPSRKVAEVQNQANRQSTTPSGEWIGVATLFDTLADRLANIERGLVADTHPMYVTTDGADTLSNKVLDSSCSFPATPNVFPTGLIMAYAGAAAPSADWLLCAGQSVLRSAYPALYAVIGTSFGDGATPGTTFAIPDLRGRVIAGIDSMSGTSAANNLPGQTTRGMKSGLAEITITEGQMPAHTHVATVGANDVGHTHAGPAHNHGGSTGSDTSSHLHSIPAHNHGGSTSSASNNHTHGISASQALNTGGGGSLTRLINLNDGTGGASVGTTGQGSGTDHSHPIPTQEATTTGNAGSVHTHTIASDSGTTGGESATHKHTVTLANTGRGEKVSNVQPTMVLNYVIRT